MSLRSEYRLDVGEEPPLSVAAAAAGGEPAHSGRARRRSSAGGGPSIGTRASSQGPLAAPPTSRLAAGGDAPEMASVDARAGIWAIKIPATKNRPARRRADDKGVVRFIECNGF